MGHLLPLDVARQRPRRSKRSGIFLAAMLRYRGRDTTVIVRNISETGAMIEANGLPEKGSEVELIRADLHAVAMIAWQDGNHAGLEFCDKISIAHWVPGLRHKDQMAVDRLVATVRNQQAKPPEERTERPIDRDQLDRRIGEELGMLSRRVGRALQSLSSFAPLIVRHPRDLQELEVIEQHLARLDKVMAAEDRQAAVEALGVEDMRRRLLR